jgi:hypothetical protein
MQGWRSNRKVAMMAPWKRKQKQIPRSERRKGKGKAKRPNRTAMTKTKAPPSEGRRYKFRTKSWAAWVGGVSCY